MGATNSLGLLLQVYADPSQAQAALSNFEKTTGTTFRSTAMSVKPLDDALLSNRESARLLSEEMGLHLPRAVSSAVAKMLPDINMIGPALLGAFAIAEIPKFVKGVEDAASALGGYTEAVQKAEKADIDASMGALIHFKTIAQGSKLIAETNGYLAELAAKQGSWSEALKAAGQAMADTKANLANLLGPIASAINAYRAYEAAVKAAADTDSEAADLRLRLAEQLDQMGKLEGDLHKEQAKDAADAAREAERLARAHQHVSKAVKEHHAEMKQLGPVFPPVIEAMMQIEKSRAAAAIHEQALDLMDFRRTLKGAALELPSYNLQLQLMGSTLDSKVVPKFKYASAEMAHFGQIAKGSLQATAEATLQAGIAAAVYGENVGKAMEQAAKATLASIAGEMGAQALKSAAYGVYYLAKYIASYGTDGAALAASQTYFVAAAEFGAIAGVTGAAGAAMPSGGYGGGAGGGRGGSTSTGPSSGGGGGQGGGSGGPGAGPQSPVAGQTVNLTILGNYYGTGGRQRLLAEISEDVTSGRGTIIATEAFKVNSRS